MTSETSEKNDFHLVLLHPMLPNRVCSLMWPEAIFALWNKRRNLHKNRVQSPKEYFTPPRWPPFLCCLLQHGRRDVMWTHSIWPTWPPRGKGQMTLNLHYSAFSQSNHEMNTSVVLIFQKTFSNVYLQWSLVKNVVYLIQSHFNICKYWSIKVLNIIISKYTLFKVSLISLWPVYLIFPLESGILRLTFSASGPARRVLTGWRSSSDSLPESLLALSLPLDDALEPRRIPPRSRKGRGELGRANACSMLSALEDRSRLKEKLAMWH